MWCFFGGVFGVVFWCFCGGAPLRILSSNLRLYDTSEWLVSFIALYEKAGQGGGR